MTRRASDHAKMDVMDGAESRFEGFGVLSAFRGAGGWQLYAKIGVMNVFMSLPDGRF